jgi:hypothetical protein
MAELAAGLELAGYRIEGLLGQGGMGVVYRATQLALDRPVALKVIASDLAADDTFRTRFKRESRLAASIRHPNVIAIHDTVEAHGRLFIAMDYIEGSDLRALIAQGPLGAARAAGLVAQVGSALDAAHRRGLVHRDVKPANILVTTEGGQDHAYLTDFGLSRNIGSETGLTESGAFLGTVDYAAPEQFEGRRVDARADVYSLGCVLYEALTAEVPFPRDSNLAKMYAHTSLPPPLPSHAAAVQPEFDAVVSRALAKDPDERYPSAGDLGRAARAAAGDPPAAAAEREVARGLAAAGRDEARPATAIGDRVGEAITAPRVSRRRRRLLIAIAATVATTIAVALLLLVLVGGSDEDGQGNAAGAVVGEPIPVGAEPLFLAVGDGAVWVSSKRDHTITRVESDSGRVAARIRLPQGSRPLGIDTRGGSVWVDSDFNAVSRIDPRTNSVEEVRVRADDTRRLEATTDGVWVLSEARRTIYKIDARSLKPSRELRLRQGNVLDLAATESTAWVLGADRRLAVVSDGFVEAGPRLPIRADTMSYRDGTLFAVGDGKVVRIDATTTAVGRPVDIAKIGQARKGQFFVTLGAESMWVASPIERVIRRFDIETGNAIGQPIRVDSPPLRMRFGEGHLWFIARGDPPALQRIRPGAP